MLDLILIAQLQPLPAHVQHLPTLDVDTTTLAKQQQTKQRQTLETQLQQVNQRQAEYQREKQALYKHLPPSRVDCYPLFPPVSGYPPGSSATSCH